MGDEIRGRFDLVIGIIEARNEQRDYLAPEFALVHHLDCVEHVREQPAQLSIVTIIEAFQIDLVKIYPGSYVVQYFRRGVAVRDVATRESRGLRLLEDLDRPFACYKRLVVTRNN